MKSTNDNGLQKQGCLLRTLPVNMKKRVDVVSSEGGTSDGLFYVPDVASADSTAQRATPVQYAKINPNEHSNVVRRNHDFHISFIGMCITPQDFGKTNELLLCSISKRNHVFSKNMEKRVTEKKKERILEKEKKKESKMTGSEEVEVTDEILADETSITDATNEKGEKLKNSEANKFPLSLSMSENDIPFIHYDPIIDGHNTGTAANSFVTIPSTKRMYLQRNGTSPDVLLDRRIMVRFTVMEIDKLSEEQMEAIKSIEKISASVGSAAAAVPYLKFVSSVLKFATHFGKSALKRACNADHVMSKDVSFMLGEPQVEKGEDGEDDTKPAASEPYGNYLRVSCDGV